jgi:hypothetical protein
MAFAFEKVFVHRKALDFADDICRQTKAFPRGNVFRIAHGSVQQCMPLLE